MNLDVYLEIGKKRTFAGAIDWPGWCRSGNDEEAALRALAACGPRYALILRSFPFAFQAPAAASAFNVIERIPGNAATDFGAANFAPASDARPLDDAELARLQALLAACWQAFDAAAGAARGKDLRLGPRGGGRDLDRIIRHALDANASYLRQLGWAFAHESDEDPHEQLQRMLRAIGEALPAAAHGEIAPLGPRGGRRWSPRYFVRRSAWHVLDHAWEIEDRVL
jgi:hypothetical protein